MDKLEQELHRNDIEAFAGRLTRFREVDAWFDVSECGLSFGPDWEAILALQEARFAYVNGFWMSAVLMAVTAMGRSLAWRLMCEGARGVEKMAAQSLIERAQSMRLITEKQAEEIGRLRKYRNAYAHFRKNSRYWETLNNLTNGSPDDDEAEGVDLNLVLHEDARSAVKLTCAYFREVGAAP